MKFKKENAGRAALRVIYNNPTSGVKVNKVKKEVRERAYQRKEHTKKFGGEMRQFVPLANNRRTPPLVARVMAMDIEKSGPV